LSTQLTFWPSLQVPDSFAARGVRDLTVRMDGNDRRVCV
jgi:hypothetical protein